jgi:adenosylcobinamide-phosphate synthase
MASALGDLYTHLVPSPSLLAIAITLDLAIGDPEYSWHPIRLVGRELVWLEQKLRAVGLDGYGGGVLLFVALATSCAVVVVVTIAGAGALSGIVATCVHVFVAYSLLALGALLRHVWKIEVAVRGGRLSHARDLVGELVGRDTDRMDAGACRRAAVESLAENFTDGFVSPLFWYVAGGLPGLVLFKVASTMDSMVGYKTPQYVRFGWWGARLDDAMNYVPARLTWVVIVVCGGLLPTYSARKAWTVGLKQHGLLLGPNSGWSEAAAAGALQRRLVGPIWLRRQLVTETWLGDPRDPILHAGADVSRALVLAVAAGMIVGAAGVWVLS